LTEHKAQNSSAPVKPGVDASIFRASPLDKHGTFAQAFS
jgi:hypothetical protein